MFRLYHSPLACSLASRLALVESGLPHEVRLVRTWLDEQKTEAYRRINPRGEVPALETADGVLTESVAILSYIAERAPHKRLLPEAGSFARAQATAWLSFLSSTLHASTSAVIRPRAGCDGEVATSAATAVVAAAYGAVDSHLSGREYLLDYLTVCDLYLLVFALWRASPQLAGKLPQLEHLDAFQQRMMARRPLAEAVGQDFRSRAGAT